jgi:hypothetical protein
MNVYNSFNELATANSTSPLVSDMSVFNGMGLDCIADVQEFVNKSTQYLDNMGNLLQRVCMQTRHRKFGDSNHEVNVLSSMGMMAEKMQDIDEILTSMAESLKREKEMTLSEIH